MIGDKYIVLRNVSESSLDISAYRLMNEESGQSLTLSGQLGPEKSLLLYTPGPLGQQGFIKALGLPGDFFQQRPEALDMTGFDLGDDYGRLRLLYTDPLSGQSIQVDALDYGPAEGLFAGNSQIPDTFPDSLRLRGLSLLRIQFEAPAPEGPLSTTALTFSTTQWTSGWVLPGENIPQPSGRALTRSFRLSRGEKVYELKN